MARLIQICVDVVQGVERLRKRGDCVEQTKYDKYEPTTAELKLLQVLLDPHNITNSITDICNQAGVSRNVYYDAVKKKEFDQLLKDEQMQLLRAKIAPLINATFKFGIELPNNYQDRKMLLQMAGVYTEKQILETENKNTNINVDLSLISEDAIEKELMKLEQLEQGRKV